MEAVRQPPARASAPRAPSVSGDLLSRDCDVYRMKSACSLYANTEGRPRHATATLLANNGMPLEEVSRYLGHSSTDVTRRYARQSPDALGRRAAEALERSGLVAIG